jgi:hypothetical protein
VRTSFLHLADTRLGFRDPDDAAVFDCVAKQFRFAVDYAIDQRTSFVVFSGNLFASPDVQPDTLHVALRGLTRLAEKNISAVAIRGQADVSAPGGAMTWYELLAQENLLASLEVDVADGGLKLSRWDRRAGAGSFVDMSRCRVFGLHYYGAMTADLVHALARSISEIDNSEMDYRIVLLHGPLEHFSEAFGARLAYGDVLLLKRHVHYLGLGGCDAPYESEGWVYNPGSAGFYHVMVDTAVEPKHMARYVGYPAPLAVSRPAPLRRRLRRAEQEERIFDALASSASAGMADRDVIRLVTQSMWGPADDVALRARTLELAARMAEGSHAP